MNQASEPFPWQQLMRFGFGVLRLSPAQFWSLSLPELNAAIEAHFPKKAEPLSRKWLEQAMTNHPDGG